MCEFWPLCLPSSSLIVYVEMSPIYFLPIYYFSNFYQFLKIQHDLCEEVLDANKISPTTYCYQISNINEKRGSTFKMLKRLKILTVTVLQILRPPHHGVGLPVPDAAHPLIWILSSITLYLILIKTCQSLGPCFVIVWTCVNYLISWKKTLHGTFK